MSKIKVIVIRTDEYEIDIDEAIWDKDMMKSYSESFSVVNTPEDVAKNLAFQVMRFGSGNFFEGFGHVKTALTSHILNGYQLNQFGSNGKLVDSDDFCKGVSLKIVSEDDDIEIASELLSN